MTLQDQTLLLAILMIMSASIQFMGNDGTRFIDVARIDGVTDGTVGSNDMPGRLSFFTTADGASVVTERMRISKKW